MRFYLVIGKSTKNTEGDFSAINMRLLCAVPWFVLIITTAAPPASIGSALSLDPNFRPPPFRRSVYPGGSAVMPNGKIVLFGYETLKDQFTPPLTRYFADGTLDHSFNFPPGFSLVTAVAPTNDNKLIICALQGQQPYYATPEQRVRRIVRVNEDGSIDSSFSSSARPDLSVRVIAVQGDGKILVAGTFATFAGLPRPGIVRLLSDGNLDPNFAAVALQPRPFATGIGVNVLAVDDDGKIVIAGSFSKVNGVDYDSVARLNPDGTLDSTFHPSGFAGGVSTKAVIVQDDRKIVLAGRFRVPPDDSDLRSLVRLNPDGSIEPKYGSFATPEFGDISSLAIQSDDKIIIAGSSVHRLNTDGLMDDSFQNAEVVDRGLSPFPRVTRIHLNADGSLVVTGAFSNIQNAGDNAPVGEHFGLARLHPNGTVDNSLVTSHESAVNVVPIAFRLDSDAFTRVVFDLNLNSPIEPTIPHNFGRLRSNGSIDPAFDPIASFDPNGELGPNFKATDIATFLANGNLFVRGGPDIYSESYVVLLPDGTPVPNYHSDYYVTFDSVTAYNSIVLVNQRGVLLAPLLRLNLDGSDDYSFRLDHKIYSDSSNGEIVAADTGVVTVLDDGKILFGYLAADRTYRLVRLNADGSTDPSFQSGSIPINTIDGFANICRQCLLPAIPAIFAAQHPFTDAQELGSGDVILVGGFSGYGSSTTRGIVRLKKDGSVDPNFHAGAGAQFVDTMETETSHPTIDNVEFSSDGKLLITGTFEAFNGTPAGGIASLNQDGTLDSTFVPPVAREKFDTRPTHLARQSDGSYLLSGPYSIPGQSPAPSFVHINNATRFTIRSVVRYGFNAVVTFDAVAGNTYRLEYKNGLTDNSWTRATSGPDLTASKTGPVRLTDPGADGSVKRIYRVRLVP